MVEWLQKENEELRQRHMPPGNNEQMKGERDAYSARGTKAKEVEKKKLHDELKILVDKYEKMAKRIEMSCSMEQLLNHTDLPYSNEVMAVPLLPRFKVP